MLRVFISVFCFAVYQSSFSDTWLNETGTLSVEVQIAEDNILNADHAIIITDYGDDPSFSRIFERVENNLYEEDYFPQTRIGFDLAGEALASDFLLISNREATSSPTSKTIKLMSPNSLFLLTAFNYMAEQGASLMVSLSDREDVVTLRVNRWNSRQSN
jgi:hypothetical protein